MVYQFKARMEQDEVFGVFDRPDAGLVCEKRSRSTTAFQAFNLYNSHFIIEQADLFAKRIERTAGSRVEDQVRHAFVLSLGREPDEKETGIAVGLVTDHGLAALARTLFNTSEFLTLH